MDVKVKDMKIEWYHGYANAPQLDMVIEDFHPDWDQMAYHRVEYGDDHTFFIHRDEPFVRFVLEDRGPGGMRGAMGGNFLLIDGTRYQTNGGWSSRPSVVNRLRYQRPEVQEILPHQLIEVSVFPSWHESGLGCVYWDKPWVEARILDFIPEVRLFCKAGGEKHHLKDDAEDWFQWEPWFATTPFTKPIKGTDEDFRTSAEHARHQSRR